MKRITTIAALALNLSALSAPAFAEGNPLAFFQLNDNNARLTPEAATSKAQGRRSSATGSRTGLGGATADVTRLAAQMGVPQALALSVCRVESHCNYGKIGRAGERGPLQIKLQTARGLGYNGTAAGLNGYQGAYWGMKHLATAYRTCGTASGAAKLHNAGLASSCSRSAYSRKVMASL